MKANWLIAAGISIVTLASFSDALQTEAQDQQFVTQAAEGGLLEVKLGELAVKSGTSAQVKDFGKAMIRDHTKVNDELKALAKKKNLNVPASLSPMKQQKYDSLASQTGTQFDMLYMNMMIASHEQTIGLFQTESTKGQDADVKKWADGKIPALKHHLEMAKKLFKSSPGAAGK
ncbi:DUF4142 domain-containing protein [Dyadobacter sandarakinus]|uniref:DUF4142 domain-containing protein n=1 Tax=Dyadobacter sandarakinus TaxID=2747268 RepID=A0ABX7I527_9BACT|nr:DUF4142 domain-containing protein [Dyadobacter sandarakinus]QRR00637.1 DUF4142 domain-containing protein [Dyadobacter sandarakinus]